VVGTLGAGTGSVYEREPNDFFINATPVAIGQDVYGVADAQEFVPYLLSDLFVFEGVAGTTLSIEALGYYPPDAQLPYASFGYDLLCGADTVDVQAAILTGQMMPGFQGGSAPPVIYTMPRTGSHYLMVNSPSFPAIPYVLRLREL